MVEGSFERAVKGSCREHAELRGVSKLNAFEYSETVESANPS